MPNTLNDDGLQTLPVERVMQHCNPFDGCWYDVAVPITRAEVAACLARGGEALTETERGWQEPIPADARERHVAKVAWFVRHGFEDPIVIDVGIPSLGCTVDYPVLDGNHRLASCIYRHEAGVPNVMVRASVSGSIDHAIDLGLWIENETDRLLDVASAPSEVKGHHLHPKLPRRG